MTEDPLMPGLSEPAPIVDIPSKITGENSNEEPVYFEISSPANPAPAVHFDAASFIDLPEQPAAEDKILPVTVNEVASNKSRLSSGGLPVKPAQIYVKEEPVLKSTSEEKPLPQQPALQEDEPETAMQLVVKETLEAAEERPTTTEQPQPIMSASVEEQAMPDETEELRRRASERIAKLRNLSFNINAADPNNEFETVPAYLRRNMEIHNQIADVETFYSNYTVRSDDNNRAEINTINNFLDGKKPD